MNDRFFLDTNIFVYSFVYSDAKCEPAQRIIEEALSSGNGCISYQVAQEFLNVALRKFKAPFSPMEARNYYLKVLKPLCAINSSPLLTLRALSIHESTGYQWYDSLIIASALEMGCRTLYTEDLQDGHLIEGLSIINPFLD